MKSLLLLTIVLITFAACQSTKHTLSPNENPPQITESKVDTAAYEVIIFDVKFDSYLTLQPPKEFYTQTYYETWNYRYATEWNLRNSNPLQYGDFYETSIDYEQDTDYGLEVNYRLYNYFLFIEKEYGITLIKRGKTSL